MGEARLHRAEAAHRPAGRVVRVDDVGVDGRVRHGVRADGEAGGVRAHRGRGRGVGPAVEHDPGLDVDQLPLAGGAVLVRHPGRVAVDVPEERLLPAVQHLHGPAGVQGQHADVDLQRDVLAGSEGSADAREREPHLVLGQVEAGRHLLAVDVQPLGRDVQVDAAVLGRDRHARLRPQEGLVLHADLVVGGDDDVGRRLLVAVADGDVAQQVAPLVQLRGVGKHGLLGVHDGLEHLVGDLDQGRRPARRLGVVGGHDGHRLALVAHPVDGHHRLVRELQAVGLPARHVGVGQDRVHPAERQRRPHVQRDDAGVRVRAAQRRAPQHPLGPQVRRVGELALHLERAVGPADALADAARDRVGRRPGLGPGGERAHAARPLAARRTASRIFS